MNIRAVSRWALVAVLAAGISAAFLAREVATQARARGLKLHYPLIGAAAYTAQLIWHGGLSGSAPLKVNEANHFLSDLIGKVSLHDTVLRPMNIVACGFLLITVPFLVAAMTPKPENTLEPSDLKPSEKILNTTSAESGRDLGA